MNVRIGLIGESSGWEALLLQEGVPFARAVEENLSPAEYSALVVCRALTAGERSTVRSYLRGGGALFGYVGYLPGIAESAGEEFALHYLWGEPHAALIGIRLLDVETVAILPREANCLRTEENEFGVFAGECEGGAAVVTPFDPGLIMEDFRSVERYFPAGPERLPSERVSRVSRAELLHFVHGALEFLHHGRGLLYVRLDAVPAGVENVFAFRVDTDGGSRADIDRLYDVARNRRIGFSWFLDVGSHRTWLDRFAAMEGQELGLHCYDHRVYLDRERDLKNIRRARAAMSEAGLPSQAFAAPFGFWSPDLGRIIDGEGFAYSSEFGLAYDTLPFTPAVGNVRFATLQVPIHPVSIGSLRMIGYSRSQMTAYYRGVIERKMSLREPLFFYHHPGHRAWDVVERICTMSTMPMIKAVTMGQYAAWWKHRGAARPRAHLEGGIIDVGLEAPLAGDADLAFRVSRPGGEEAVVASGMAIPSERLNWKRNPPHEIPDDVRRIREFNLRGEIGRQFTRFQRRFT
jgi:hypothetical protein